jgi:hypothetical protein
MTGSFLRIDYSSENVEAFTCDCGKCEMDRFDIVYSWHHANLIGWKIEEVPKDEWKELKWKGHTFPHGCILLCPDCAKNTEQQVQVDSPAGPTA